MNAMNAIPIEPPRPMYPDAEKPAAAKRKPRYFLIPIVAGLALMIGVTQLTLAVAAKNVAQKAGRQAALEAQTQKPFHVLKAASLGATGVYVTTLSKGAYQTPNSVSFQTLNKSFTSSAVSVLNQTVSASTTSNIMTAASSGTMQMLYAYSTTMDGTLSVFNNTVGTGSAAATVAITAGTPYEWDSLTSGTTAMNLAGTNSISFSAGTTSGGAATANTQTAITAAALYP